MKIRQSHLELSILCLILYSIIIHFVELEFNIAETSGSFFLWSERIVAIIFTVEYFARWIASGRLWYPFRLLAVVDLLAILPFYLGFLFDLRSLRLLRAIRVLRLFKLYRYTDAIQSIKNAFAQVQYEFGIIGFAVLTLAWICSVAVFELERHAQPEAFSRLTDAVWYTVTTLTTVGYGDKVPITFGGRCVAIFMMVCGLGLFGTFVSLIGSAFLDELRKNPRRSHKKPHSPKRLEFDELPDSSEGFDPGRVLRAIHEGTLAADQHSVRMKTIRLLTTACLLLQHNAGNRASYHADDPPEEADSDPGLGHQ